MRYRFAVLDAPQTPAPTDGPPDALRSSYAAYYYPWILVAGSVGAAARSPFRLAAAVAGIYARSDREQGVWHAPADKEVLGITGLDQSVTEAARRSSEWRAVSIPCAVFLGRGNRVWGARTTSQDPEWKYVNLRRYLSYLEHSIENGTQWVVFEPNGEQPLGCREAQRFRFSFQRMEERRLTGFEARQTRSSFAATGVTMTQNDLDNGRLIMEIGVAALRPAEFVIFRIGQWTADAKDCGR